MNIHRNSPWSCLWHTRITPMVVLDLACIFFVSTQLSAKDEPAPNCSHAVSYRGPNCRAAVALPSPVSLDDFKEELFSNELEKGFSSALATAREKTSATAITAAVAIPGHGFWTSTLTENTQVPPPRFYWASAGKTFTAVLILQLIEEGKLSLETPIARWFPSYPNASIITINHLLTHTSGIFSFNQDRQFARKPRTMSPTELVAIAQTHANRFCPGEHWSYSNTGYVMLGFIAEQIDARSYAESVDARIVRRLGLKHTNALLTISGAADIAQPHPSQPVGALVEISKGLPQGAGCIVATAGDMVRFWHGLLAGRLLTTATVSDMFTTLFPMFDQHLSFYGRSVMVTDVPDTPADVWLGHSGGTAGIKAEIIYSTNTGAFVAVALNNDGSAQSTVNLLLKTLRSHQAKELRNSPDPGQ